MINCFIDTKIQYHLIMVHDGICFEFINLYILLKLLGSYPDKD